ncbi:hypothetical protein [Fluoribacter gormanii]|uniref:hypothetical protein n=1 Tax=Fluoribacter gormanii TaxID=464 RepID=UPI0010418D71|nr:hypothetical protein [Fluoribacter gormanii]
MTVNTFCIFRAHPEAIKMLPLVQTLETSRVIQNKICITGQYRQFLELLLALFRMKSDLDFFGYWVVECLLNTYRRGLTQEEASTALDKAVLIMRKNIKTQCSGIREQLTQNGSARIVYMPSRFTLIV